jgi:hypothetical protein
MKFKFLFLLGVIISLSVQAQKKAHEMDPQDYQYKHEASGGIRVQTNGVTLYAQYGWIKDIYRTRLLQIDYTYNINYTDKKLKAKSQNSRDYFFGVQNKFHAIRISYGLMRNIADKANRNGVRLSFIFFGGFSLGLLKPYYLDLWHSSDTGPKVTHEGYSTANENRFLDNDSIQGAAPIRYGLNKMEPVPGLNLRTGLNFDWGTKDAFVKSLEAGILLDAYYKQLPLMVNNHNHFYQIAFYLSFHLGKRW